MEPTIHATPPSPSNTDATLYKHGDGDDNHFSPKHAKQQRHYSHISADSATTTEDDDDLSQDRHRRSQSGSDSLYSVATEVTEQTTFSKDHSPLTGQQGLLLQRSEQLDPWGSNPYDQEDLASTLRFAKTPGQVDDDPTTPLAGPRTAAPNAINTAATPSIAIAITSPQDTVDPLERMDREFQRLTQGQALEPVNVQTTPAASILALDFDREQLDDPRGIVERSLSDAEKRVRLSKLFSRAASNGDMNQVADMLDNFRTWIDLEAQDEDGTTPLIYAACFGHVEIAFMLLEAGAAVDARDKFGWSALVWATNNKHDHMVRLLLEQGASTSEKTAKGHTIVDFLRHDPNDNTKIVQIFQEPGRRDSISSNGSLVRNNSPLGDDLFYQAGIEGFEEMMAENERRYRIAMDNANTFDVDMADISMADQPQLDDEGDFDWDRCLPDQMFVFSSKDVPHIIETTITTMEPTRSRTHKPIPAYVLFLAARFAHYFSSPELLDELLEAISKAIDAVTKARPEDMTLTAYWISNACVLLHFLRKDPGLSMTSGFHQVKIEKLVQGLLQMIVKDAERRIEKILEPAMLDHDTIQGLDEVKFQSDWAFLWRGSLNAAKSLNNTIKRANSPLTPQPTTLAAPTPLGGSQPSSQTASPTPTLRSTLRRNSSHPIIPTLNRPPSPRQRRISPRTITTMLSSLLFVMQTYDIHPDIVQYVIAQLLYYVATEVFNRIMTTKKFLSRSKALQTRLNLSILEDWIRLNNLSQKLSEQFAHLIQLLQLLQVLSLQEDFPTWIETMKKLDLLNPAQVKRVVNAYRFEVNEERLPEEITHYVLQVASDTEKMIRRQMMDRKRERPLTMLLDTPASVINGNSHGNGMLSRKNSTVSNGVRTSSSSNRPGNNSPKPSKIIEEDETELEQANGVNGAGSSSPSSARNSVSLSHSFSSAGLPILVTEADKARARERQREQEAEEAMLSETRNSKSWLPFTLPENLAMREGGVERVFVPLISDEMMSLLDTFVA